MKNYKVDTFQKYKNKIVLFQSPYPLILFSLGTKLIRVYFILFANFFIFFGNINIIILKKKTKEKVKYYLFKNIDIYILNFALKSYSKFLNYLNINFRKNVSQNQLKKTIKIFAVDVYSVFDIKNLQIIII